MNLKDGKISYLNNIQLIISFLISTLARTKVIKFSHALRLSREKRILF